MANPSLHDVHVEGPLANISIAYKNAGYIADQIFPNVPVQKKSDKYFVFEKTAWFRDEISERGPGAEAQETDYGITTASYNCTTRALAKVVPDEVRNNADSPLRPDVEAVEFVTDKLLLGRERRVAALTTGGSGLWAYSTTPSVQWSSDSSEPLTDIEKLIDGVVGSIGRFPNVAVMSWAVWKALRNHPDLLERVKYTRNDSIVRVDDLQMWTGIPKILVGMQIFDSGKEGATSSIGYVWGDQFWAGYVPMNPSLMTPAAGYTFTWENRTVKRYRLDTRHSDKIEVEESTDERISASDAAGILYNTI
jgi:hypothetical protein